MAPANEPLGMVGRRYIVQEQLGKGGMGVVYKALDSFTGKQVALKKSNVLMGSEDTLAPTVESTEFRLVLVNEFKILAGLRHPNIISVLDYGFDEDRSPYFTMELLQGGVPLIEAGKDRLLEYQVGLVVQVLQALAYLHRHHILHRDLKPANVLVVDDEVRVLDFGIAMLRKQTDKDDPMVSGTLMYMAPEVLRGEPPSLAADLYAVGVMAYELFAGEYPFPHTDTSHLLNDILFTAPNISAEQVGGGLAVVIQRLLSKSPDDRYENAVEVIKALNEATGQHFPVETAATRSSFLEAAPFAGREAEMARLLSELEAAFNGAGRAWLVGGESGVGKSRLLDELRIHALVEGANVLRGQAVSEGGNPFQVWQDVLFRLSVMSEITTTEASILSAIVPKIASIVGGDIVEPPELEAGAAQDRIFRTIAGIFARLDSPLLVILSDLHWADDESLQLLARLLPVVEQERIMIVGSYRDDEKPRLPEQLPGMNLLKLKRLNAAGIEEVLASMVGSTRHNPALVELLERETEGNMYFLLEVVGALAEEAGELAGIANMALPEKVVTGGVQAVIGRRLERVPASSRPLLNLAAVAGRQLDLAVLKKLEPDVDFDDWLSDATDAAVLMVEEETWSFTHNKVRDQIVAGLDEGTLRGMHRRLAEAIEAAYPDGAGQYAALAQHWEWAQERDKAFRWYRLAGKQSQEAYAPIKAIEYYQKALSLAATGRKAARERVEIYTGLGQMLRWQARFDEAAEVYRSMESEAEDLGDKVALARALIGLGDVLNSQGDRQGALEYAQQAEIVAREAGEQAKAELVEALGNKAWGQYRLKQYDAALATAQEAHDLAYALTLRWSVGRNLNTLGIVNFMMGEYEAAERYMQQAVEIARELDDKRDVAVKLNNLGEMRRLRGDSEGAISFYKEALNGFREIGYRDNELALLNNLGAVYVELSEYKTAQEYLDQVVSITGGKDWWGLYETYLHLAEATFAQNNLAAASDAALRALTEGSKTEDKTVMGKAWRLLAQISARLGMFAVVDGKNMSVSECFEKSADSFPEGDGERARTLETWAIYEYDSHKDKQAKTLFQQAYDLYTALGMTADAERVGKRL